MHTRFLSARLFGLCISIERAKGPDVTVMNTTFLSTRPQSSTPAKVTTAMRFLTLDAGRGAVMLFLVSSGFGLQLLAGHPIIANQFHHAPWGSMHIWDVIHPAFSFMVGASLAFALARRREQGVRSKELWGRVLTRVLKLVVLGQILHNLFYSGPFRLTTDETLTEIATDYFGCFLILQLKRFRWQLIVTAAVFTLSCGLYVLFPGPDGPFSPTTSVGVRIDRFVFGMDHAYDWPNLDQLGSLVTTMFGAWTGMLVRSDVLPARKLKLLLLAMSISFAAGFATNQFSPCMYQLYTAPFIFHTTDFILLAVSVFFWLFDLKAYGKLAYPLVVLGMNSIFVYWVWEVLRRRAASRLAVSTHRDNYSASAVSGCVCSCDSGVGRLFCDVVSVLLAVQAEHFPKSLNPRGSAVGYRKLTDDHSMRSSRSLEEVEAPDTLQPFGSAPVGAHLLPPFV